MSGPQMKKIVSKGRRDKRNDRDAIIHQALIGKTVNCVSFYTDENGIPGCKALYDVY